MRVGRVKDGLRDEERLVLVDVLYQPKDAREILHLDVPLLIDIEVTEPFDGDRRLEALLRERHIAVDALGALVAQDHADTP